MSTGENVDERISRLWNTAARLEWSEEDCEQQIAIYTEILELVKKLPKRYKLEAIYRNRALAYRTVKRYDEAFADLGNELRIAQENKDRLRISDCKETIEETRRMQQGLL